jgi:hypothetical protein
MLVENLITGCPPEAIFLLTSGIQLVLIGACGLSLLQDVRRHPSRVPVAVARKGA